MDSEGSKEEKRTLEGSIRELRIVANRIDVSIFGEHPEKVETATRPMPDNKIAQAREDIDDIANLLRKAVQRLEVL